LKTETKNRVAKRMRGVQGEAAFETLAKANELERQGVSIVHLEIGEPDFDTPSRVVQAGIEALRAGATHYSPVPGIPELRQAIAGHLSLKHGLTIDPATVLVSPGAKMMIFSIIQTLVDPGDEVIFPAPVYPAYEAAIQLAGATPVPVILEEHRQFRFDLDEVAEKITPRTRMIVINSPQNPTGGVLTLDDLKQVCALAERHDLLILSDEIYSEIYYGERPASMLDVGKGFDRLLLVDGFSKSLAMTGWRLGFAVVPRDIVPAVTLFMNSSVASTATFTQRAALEAFDENTRRDVHAMVQEFRQRRDVLVDGLNRIPGIRCLKPEGAFYVFPNIVGLGMPSKQLADRLLNEAGVSVLPGTAFGEYGEGYLRISFANSLPNIESALKRIDNFVSRTVMR
jgi:aspartate/methionine/tyrosine aminotransferase